MSVKKTNRSYRIKRTDTTMVIETNPDGEHIAEYRFESPSSALSEIRSMYRVIDRHLAKGGTLGNYQW
jgi:hypothetical protein